MAEEKQLIPFVVNAYRVEHGHTGKKTIIRVKFIIKVSGVREAWTAAREHVYKGKIIDSIGKDGNTTKVEMLPGQYAVDTIFRLELDDLND